MNWCELITDLYEADTQKSTLFHKPEFHCPATVRNIADVEEKLNVALPVSLRSLLLESDGVMAMLRIEEGDWFENMWLLWSTSEIIQQNLLFRAESTRRTYRRIFDDLVFFAGAGADGILFGFPVMETRVCKTNIVV